MVMSDGKCKSNVVSHSELLWMPQWMKIWKGKKRGGHTEVAPRKDFWHDSIFSCNRRLRESFSVCSIEIVLMLSPPRMLFLSLSLPSVG